MKLARTITSGFLASTVLMASIGVTLNFHLCAGKIQSIAVFLKAEPCTAMQKSCHGTTHCAKKKGCCEEQSIVVKGKETNAEVNAPTQISPSFNFIAIILPVLYSLANADDVVTARQYTYHKPPLIERDITVLVHSFLI